MEPELISQMTLKNGLTLNILDASREVAAGRWFVSLIAQIDIAVDQQNLGPDFDQDHLNEIREILGETISYEKKLERNFISADQKEPILDRMTVSISEISDSYLGHPEFAAKYILKSFKERKTRLSWYKQELDSEELK